jgi:hypothetical protein
MYKDEWLPRMRFVFILSWRRKKSVLFSTYCHILQYHEDEIKTLDDVWIFSVLFVRYFILFVKVVFDIEQLNFDDTNKFPDWRLTVDVELERFRAQYVLEKFINLFDFFWFRLQDEHFWTRMFNVNRLLHLSEWWTEPNAQKSQLGLMKYVRFHF